jgi:hypothetical protein
MNANEIAEELESIHWLQDGANSKPFKQYADFIRQQQAEIKYWEEKFNKAMAMQEVKPAKYTDAWWKEAEEFNKRLKAQEK